MLDSDVYAEGGQRVLQAGFEAAESGLWVVNPTFEILSQFVSVFRDPPSRQPTPVRLFAARQPLMELADDFLHASVAAELVADGRLEVRTFSSVPRCSLLVTEGSVVSLIDCEEGVAGLSTTVDSVVRPTYEEYTTRWERAEPFSFQTPPLSEIRTSLETDVGPAVAEDFDRALVALEGEASGTTDDVLDEVTLALLVAAQHGALLYDISRWGENIRLASKATFSRSKNRLEERGLLDTEKVPIDVGRPRLRLVPGEAVPETGDIERVVRRARSTLE
jgi:hypothetical protein